MSAELAEDANLSGNGISFGRSYTFLSAHASPEYWVALTSGGAITNTFAANPILTVVARDPANPGENAPPVRVELPSNVEALQNQACYRARILGIEMDFCTSATCESMAVSICAKFSSTSSKAFPSGPQETIALSTEAVGMAILPDGARLIGREDGFTFLHPECRE